MSGYIFLNCYGTFELIRAETFVSMNAESQLLINHILTNTHGNITKLIQHLQ